MSLACAVLTRCATPERDAKPLRTTGAETPVTQAGTLSPPVAPNGSMAKLRVEKSPIGDTLLIAGDLNDASDRSSFTAYASAQRIARIVEQSAPGSEASASREWLYDSNQQLASVSDEKSQLASNGNASPTMMRVKTNIELRGTEIIRATRTVDGVSRTLQPWDIDNYRRHSDALLSLARQGLSRH